MGAISVSGPQRYLSLPWHISAPSSGRDSSDNCGVGYDQRSHKAGHQLRSLEGYTGPVTTVALSANGRAIVSGSADHTVRTWDLESEQLRLLFWNDASILSIALSPDGRTLFCGDSAGRVWIFEWVR